MKKQTLNRIEINRKKREGGRNEERYGIPKKKKKGEKDENTIREREILTI